jgi:hypothetical protein
MVLNKDQIKRFREFAIKNGFDIPIENAQKCYEEVNAVYKTDLSNELKSITMQAILDHWKVGGRYLESWIRN